MLRGCLTVIVLVAAFVVGVVWFAGPVVASALAPQGLALVGFTAAAETVHVQTAAPLQLLLGRADSVRIQATDASFGSIRASAVDVTLRDVDAFARSFDIDGTLTGASMVQRGGIPVVASQVALSGEARSVLAAIHLDGGLIRQTATSQLEAASGQAAALGDIVLEAPNVVTVSVAGRTIRGTLTIDETGALVLSVPEVGVTGLTLLAPVQSVPLRLTGISIVGSEVVLLGTVDLTELFP
ncbi:MAG TPA: hypothetical protein VIM30_10820 [Candidatus Limnocylindrales bacterium]